MQSVNEGVPWDQVAAVRSSATRRTVVEALAESPRYASEIADREGLSRQAVSKQFRWLKQQEPPLLQCLTPNRPHHVIYGLTETGERVAANI